MSQTKAQLIDSSLASVAFGAGSAAAPSVYYATDPTTGIYFPATGQLALSAAGSARLSIDVAGNIVIPNNLIVNGTAQLANATATTPSTVDNSTKVATTAFVQAQGYATLASPTFTGTVTIPAGASISGYALLASPTFTGTPLAPTAAVATNTTQIATTAFVQSQGFAPIANPTFTGVVTIPSGASIGGYLTTTAASTTYAALASPALTGTPTAPTAAAATNTTQIATTAFVQSAVSGGTGGYAPIASPTFTGTVTIPAGASISGYALLAGPALTGTPTAPTAATVTNTTQIATTAFVKAQAYATLASPTFTGTVTIPAGASISGFAPLASPTFTGTVTIPAGASISGFAPLASPALTGTPTAPTAIVATNNTQIATTAYVKNQGYLIATDVAGIYAPLANPTFTGTVAADSLTLNNGYGSSATAYGCRAWVNFDSTRNVTDTGPSTNGANVKIRASGNVTSVLKTALGDYTVTFTTAISDANYSAIANYSGTNTLTGGVNDGQAVCWSHATNTVRVLITDGAGALRDAIYCSVAIFR